MVRLSDAIGCSWILVEFGQLQYRIQMVFPCQYIIKSLCDHIGTYLKLLQVCGMMKGQEKCHEVVSDP